MSWIEKGSAFIDHVRLTSADFPALSEVEHLTLWAVDLAEPHLLARLKRLRALDWRGGRIEQLAQISDCKRLQKLAVSHNRKLQSLDFLRESPQLEGLSLYALPGVTDLSALLDLTKLRRLDLGALRSVSSFEPLLGIPCLEALYLIKRIGIARPEIERLGLHPGLKAVEWWNPDEPRWTSEAIQKLQLPKARWVRFEAALWLPER